MLTRQELLTFVAQLAPDKAVFPQFSHSSASVHDTFMLFSHSIFQNVWENDILQTLDFIGF
jgi:hypothetical protein